VITLLLLDFDGVGKEICFFPVCQLQAAVKSDVALQPTFHAVT